MSLLRTITSGLRTLFRKEEVERELDDEVAQYVEAATQAHMRAGLSRAAAERAARIDVGGVETTKENVRSSGWDATVETVLRDVRYAARGLARNPGFTIVVVLTLALGIGVNTVMFSVVNAVMLRPLPYRDAGRLALVWTDDARRALHEEATAFATIIDWRNESRTFDGIAFYSAGRMTLSGSAGRERSRGAFVSGNLFSVLGVSPMRGRGDRHQRRDQRRASRGHQPLAVAAPLRRRLERDRQDARRSRRMCRRTGRRRCTSSA